MSVGQCYDLSMKIDDSGNPYGLTTNANSHLMKNSEWGVVAYLSISKYGYSGGTSSTATEKYKNNLSIFKINVPNKTFKVILKPFDVMLESAKLL